MKPRRVLIANPCVETQRLAIVLQKHGWEVISETRLDRLAQACKLHKPTVGLFRLDDVQISRLDNQVRSLLAALIAAQGRVLTHRQLLLQVWGPEYLDRPHYLRVHMANLRQKLESDPAQPRHLVTELQVGYRLVGLEG